MLPDGAVWCQASPVVELDHIGWHGRQVLKGAAAEAA